VPDRVPQDVVDHAREIVVADDAAGAEAVAEQVAFAIVLPVETLRVHAVDAVERPRERRLRRLDDEVVVVPEQRQGVDRPVICLDGVAQELQEREAVTAVAEDRAAVHALDPDVEDAVGEPAPERSSHRLRRYARGAPPTARSRQSSRFCARIGAADMSLVADPGDRPSTRPRLRPRRRQEAQTRSTRP
jgi:hypothetical protein